METTTQSSSPPARSLPEAVARSLRHEVGDLLQTVYATVAILQKRLPAECTLERRLLADMRSRAEGCKRRLDAVHDLACTLSYSHVPVDLGEIAASVVATAAARYPNLEIKAEAVGRPTVLADAARLAQLAEILITNACEAAQTRVLFRSKQDLPGGVAEWQITDDGPGVSRESLEQIFQPFFTTRHGHLGVGLALAQKLAAGSDASLKADNLPGGGFQMTVTFPGSSAGKQL